MVEAAVVEAAVVEAAAVEAAVVEAAAVEAAAVVVVSAAEDLLILHQRMRLSHKVLKQQISQ